jgi:hypothetical protein
MLSRHDLLDASFLLKKAQCSGTQQEGHIHHCHKKGESSDLEIL